MTIDFWGLGLQAVNVLILIWLLSRFFWRPVAAAIAERQKTANAVIGTAQATQVQVEAALAAVSQARDGIDAERRAVLAAAQEQAETATKAAAAEARAKADTLLASARATIAKDSEAAHKANAEQATDLSILIAARLLERLNGPAVQAAFLHQLIDAIAAMPEADRTALADDPRGIEIVSATDAGAQQAQIEAAIRSALGAATILTFTTDPHLIGGLELRSPHFALHNSWQADLAQIRKAVTDAV